MYITFFFLLLSGVLYFQSPLSKIGTITVKGNQSLSPDFLVELSDLKIGTSFWKVNQNNVTERIKKHSEIKNVNIEKKLPNTIVINITEYKRVGYINRNNQFLPIIENGDIITPNKNDENILPADAPILVGWDEKGAKILAKELAEIQPSIAKLISEIHFTPTEYDPLHMTLYMNDGYEVRATVRSFSKNIEAYPSIVSELDPSLNGYIELDVVPTFIPYEYQNTNEEEMDTNESEG